MQLQCYGRTDGRTNGRPTHPVETSLVPERAGENLNPRAENEKFLAAYSGLMRVAYDRTRPRADRVKARDALAKLLDTTGGCVLAQYAGGARRDTRGAEYRVEADYDGWGEYR